MVNKILGIFLDFYKASDSISHITFKNILKSIGIVNNQIFFLVSYLSNRKQLVRTSSTLSDEITIITGVSQGIVFITHSMVSTRSFIIPSLKNLNLYDKLFFMQKIRPYL